MLERIFPTLRYRRDGIPALVWVAEAEPISPKPMFVQIEYRRTDRMIGGRVVFEYVEPAGKAA